MGARVACCRSARMRCLGEMQEGAGKSMLGGRNAVMSCLGQAIKTGSEMEWPSPRSRGQGWASERAGMQHDKNLGW